MFDREQMIEEIRIRDMVARAVRVRAKKLRESIAKEENELRNIIRGLIQEASSDKVQHRSTGINVLEDLLKKIIPVLEQDYKMLTTDAKQRRSFSAHIVTAVQNSLSPLDITKAANSKGMISVDEISDIDEIEVVVGDDEGAFIDIDADGEETPFQDLEGEDRTGNNFAQATFDKIETQIKDAFSLLGNEEDQELFSTYLITNIKLYFDMFEDELKDSIVEPSNDEYEEEKASDEDTNDESDTEELEL